FPANSDSGQRAWSSRPFGRRFEGPLRLGRVGIASGQRREESTMKRGLSLWVIIVVGMFATIAGCGRSDSLPEPSNSASTPDLVGVATVDPYYVELGTVPIYTQKRFTTRFINRGPITVEIDGFESSCGCADLAINQSTCKPGHVVELSGRFRAQTLGPFRKR